jgi:hypothetical protein
MSKQKRAKAVATFNLGDRVKIKDYAGKVGRIVELRGALGPGGASVYRVLVQRKPTASYIELLDSQLEAIPRTGPVHGVKKPRPAPRRRKSP